MGDNYYRTQLISHVQGQLLEHWSVLKSIGLPQFSWLKKTIRNYCPGNWQGIEHSPWNTNLIEGSAKKNVLNMYKLKNNQKNDWIVPQMSDSLKYIWTNRALWFGKAIYRPLKYHIHINKSCKELATDWPLLTKTVNHLGCQQGTCSIGTLIKKRSPIFILEQVEISEHCPFTKR